jgi:hypothetical protein
MIRTKQPQVVDAMNRESAVVYMEACNRRESKEAQTVTFDVFMYTIESVTRIENVNVLKTRLDGETGETVNYYEAEERNVTRPFLKIISKRDAIYKMSTFYGAVGNPTPSQYDDVMIAQIAFINSKVWDGTEAQKVYFWELTASDVEKVTADEMQNLLSPIVE